MESSGLWMRVLVSGMCVSLIAAGSVWENRNIVACCMVQEEIST